MGRASSSKRSRHLSDGEKQRREEQSNKASKDTALRDKRGTVILDDPTSTFSLRFDINVPGGPLRSPFPSKSSGKLVANSEADLLRDTVLTLIELYGWAKFGKAAAGVIADAVNSYPMEIRQELFKLIAQGAGVNLFVTEVTSCKFCGAERELVSLIDTEGDELEEQDTTVHRADCPALPQVDAEAIAAADEGDSNDPPMRPGVEQEWFTGPAVMIDNPMKYRPLFQPAADDEPELAPMPDGDTPVELPA